MYDSFLYIIFDDSNLHSYNEFKYKQILALNSNYFRRTQKKKIKLFAFDNREYIILFHVCRR